MKNRMDCFSDNLSRYGSQLIGGGLLGLMIGGHVGASIGVAIGVISARCAIYPDNSSVANSQGTQAIALKNRKSWIGRFANFIRYTKYCAGGDK